MSVFVDKQRLLTEEDMANTNVGVNLAYGDLFTANSYNSCGNTRQASATASGNFFHTVTMLNGNFKKGDVVTISAFGNLTGPNVKDGYYKATIFNSDYSVCYDDNQDSILLSQGMWSSKQVVFNADSDPNKPPLLLLYPGLAPSTVGNTLMLNGIKVERGSVATQYSPAPQDLVLQSDLDSLKAEIEQLKQNK